MPSPGCDRQSQTQIFNHNLQFFGVILPCGKYEEVLQENVKGFGATFACRRLW